MQTQQSRYSPGCSETKGSEVFYGYCHDSRRMRMMDYTDYMSNMQRGYSNLYQSPTTALQQMVDMVQSATAATPAPSTSQHHKHHGCNCHQEEDCSCNCCIRCADTVEYARCGETRKIPITFENDSRRERQVTVQMGGFLTDSGQQLAWKTDLSETQFTLPPCGEKTISITVSIDCGQTNPDGNTGNVTAVVGSVGSAVDSCKVGYAKLSADGCLIRPLVVAVAVLPDHCGAHQVGCLCGCC
jgi:hypothetical protein